MTTNNVTRGEEVVTKRKEDDDNEDAEGEEEEEEEEEEQALPTKELAILRGGVPRRALDLLLIRIGVKGFYPLGVFLLLFYANSIAKMYIPLTTFAAWLPHHCCQVNGSLVEVQTESDVSMHYRANWSYNDRKHHPDPPPKLKKGPAGARLNDFSPYQHHRQQHRLHRQDNSGRAIRMKDDEKVCTNLVKEYGWRYATQKGYSLVADMDLGCRNATHLMHISNALFMAGFGIGGLIHGVIADYHGRKIVLVYSSLLLPVVGALSAAKEDENFYVGMRCLQGFFEGGVLLASSTMICELFPSSMRAIPHLMCQNR